MLVPSGRLQILEDGSLLIAAVRATDAGKYTCIRTNEAGSVEESAYLSVLGTIVWLVTILYLCDVVQRTTGIGS